MMNVNGKNCVRYLHLDFKGIVPSMNKIPLWFDFFRRCGFDGLVLEFDCRTAWETWKYAGMPVYSPQDTAEIVKYAEHIGFDVIPLMQIQGHFEWILGQPEYAGMRENGKLTLCPSHPDSKKMLLQWMKEIRGLFPHSRYIHLGADEVAALGECPRCAEKATKEGAFSLYRDHLACLCGKAIEMDFTPLIWADMALRPDAGELLNALPPETIVVNWRYWGAGPFESTEKLKTSGLRVWGASAVKCAWYENMRSMMNFPLDRLENIDGWNRYEGTVIHTNWGRPGNKWCLYPPWHVSLPLFLAAASPEQWKKHPWHDCFTEFADVLRGGREYKMQEILKQMPDWQVSGELERESLVYFQLALRYHLLVNAYYFAVIGKRCIDAAIPFIGKDDWRYRQSFVESPDYIQRELDGLMKETQEFFRRNELIGAEEYVAERRAVFAF